MTLYTPFGAPENLDKDSDNGSLRLTKREYFAGLAMQAALSNEELRIACMADAHILGVSRDEAVARYSVMEADALLKQLEQ